MINFKDLCVVLSRSDAKGLCILIESLLGSPAGRDRYRVIDDLGVTADYRIYQDLRDALKED